MSSFWEPADDFKGELKFDNDFEPSEQFEPMADRVEYLNKLESKLKKIKGTGREPSTKDILNCLNSAKEDFVSKFHSQESNNSDSQILEEQESLGFNTGKLLTDLERVVFPNRSTNNPEELEKLLKCDILAILAERAAKSDKTDDGKPQDE
ncbi:uncharacterized protein LOC107366060 [Tetranychus urticae]|uniref:Uncharacterized protein n=1 Tax=Tetranychus urticae TaxID=32264 RepID=T1KPU0_TETUR|nr:uncharacterized protein LOC107366060 [Tetranychus urticae]